MRRLLGAVFLGLLLATSIGARAQVVIRERVEVRPGGAGGVTHGPVTANSWPGGVRGRGVLRVTLNDADLYVKALGDLTVTLELADNSSVSLPLSAPSLSSTVTRCIPSTLHPTWDECLLRGYNGALLAEVELDTDDEPVGLRITGPALIPALHV